MAASAYGFVFITASKLYAGHVAAQNGVFCYAATILAQYFTQVYLIFIKSDGFEPSCYTVGQKNVTALL